MRAKMEIKKIKARLDAIPQPCRTCLYWEAPGEYQNDNGDEEAILKKQEWFTETLDEFGNCAFLAYDHGDVIGYAQYAPVDRFLNIAKYPAASTLYDANTEEETIFLSCLFIPNEENRGKGVGSALLNKIIENLRFRGYNLLVTFARRKNPNNPSGSLEFLKKNGFKIEEDHPTYPLLSLDLIER